MKGRKLEAWEALEKLHNKKSICNQFGTEHSSDTFFFYNNWSVKEFNSQDWYEYTEPKKLSELFLIEWKSRLKENPFTAKTGLEDVYNWLKRQEGEK